MRYLIAYTEGNVNNAVIIDGPKGLHSFLKSQYNVDDNNILTADDEETAFEIGLGILEENITGGIDSVYAKESGGGGWELFSV